MGQYIVKAFKRDRETPLENAMVYHNADECNYNCDNRCDYNRLVNPKRTEKDGTVVFSWPETNMNHYFTGTHQNQEGAVVAKGEKPFGGGYLVSLVFNIA